MAFDKDYLEALEPVAAAYRDRIEEYVREIGELCKARGFALEGPWDMSADNYEWTLLVWISGQVEDSSRAVSVNVVIDEQRDYEGGEGFGMNFGLTAYGPDGTTVGELRPFNFSEDVWVDARDEAAVAERWAIFEGSDTSNIPDLMCKGAKA